MKSMHLNTLLFNPGQANSTQTTDLPKSEFLSFCWLLEYSIHWFVIGRMHATNHE